MTPGLPGNFARFTRLHLDEAGLILSRAVLVIDADRIYALRSDPEHDGRCWVYDTQDGAWCVEHTLAQAESMILAAMRSCASLGPRP